MERKSANNPVEGAANLIRGEMDKGLIPEESGQALLIQLDHQIELSLLRPPTFRQRLRLIKREVDYQFSAFANNTSRLNLFAGILNGIAINCDLISGNYILASMSAGLVVITSSIGYLSGKNKRQYKD